MHYAPFGPFNPMGLWPSQRVSHICHPMCTAGGFFHFLIFRVSEGVPTDRNVPVWGPGAPSVYCRVMILVVDAKGREGPRCSFLCLGLGTITNALFRWAHSDDILVGCFS